MHQPKGANLELVLGLASRELLAKAQADFVTFCGYNLEVMMKAAMCK